MIDPVAYYKACNAPAKCAAGARITGGDKPCWDMDYEYWIGEELEREEWWKDTGRMDGPTYVSARDAQNGEIISGEIDNE